MTKKSLTNKHSGNGDYFVIVVSSLHPLLLTEYAANGLVEAPLKLIERMKDLLLCVYVVVKTFSLKFHVVIWQTTSKNCTKVRAALAARLVFHIQPIRSLFSGVVLAVATVLA